MSTLINITASIVIYKEDKSELLKAIDSVVKSKLVKTLYIIDNSPKENSHLKDLLINDSVEYIYTGKNIGFGTGHNLILEKIKGKSLCHLILNPDVYFQPEVLKELSSELQKDSNLSMIAPKILFPNEEIQYTIRKYPTILEFSLRFLRISNRYTKNREYRDQNLEKPFYPDFIHGNFMLFKTEDLIKIEGFDTRYFLYMEDVDICKRIDQLGKRKMYFPKVKAYHIFKKGSSKKSYLFFTHLISIYKYFMKWGF
tara:strand:+ start:24363 stop:25127 length:765 start_codon:yes stop_codon:yes gene_type:complete